MQFEDALIQKNLNNLFFKFISLEDTLLELDFNKTIFGKGLREVIDLKSKNYGIDLNLFNIEEISFFLTKKIRENFEVDSTYSIKNNNLTSFFYTVTQIPIENIQLFSVFEFKIEISHLTKNEWTNLFGMGPRECCLKNYVSYSDLPMDSLDTFKRLSCEELENFCVFPPAFLNIKAKVWVHLLNSEDSFVKKKFESLKLNLSNPLTQNFFGGVPVDLIFLNTSEQTLQRKRAETNYFNNVPDFFNSSFKVLLREYLDSMYSTKINCRDLLTHLSIEDSTLENYLLSCLYNCYLTFSFLKSKTEKIESRTKLIFCSFFL